MREYEFRGKSDDEWVYGMLLKTEENDYGEHGNEHFDYLIQTEEDKEFERSKFYITDNSTIGQYTGLKDKNEKKIFEGDILLRKNGQFESIVLVKWGKVEFSFLYKSRYNGQIRKGKWIRGTYQGLDGYAEVIGNIYDNPELLKEEL